MKELAKRFDAFMNPERPFVSKTGDTQHPTKQSIQTIEQHFGVRLPKAFIDFARYSKHYDCWFASLGEDYDSHDHIIRVNSHYKSIRRRKDKRWVYVKPDNFLLIHADFHDHCLGIWLDDTLKQAGEYPLQYWFQGYEQEFGDCYDNFTAYLVSLINHFAEK